MERREASAQRLRAHASKGVELVGSASRRSIPLTSVSGEKTSEAQPGA
jgi:hypothetical protein